MQVPWRIHGGLVDVGSMEVLKALYLHLLALSCSLTDAGLMEVPWRFDVGFMEVLKAPVSTLVGSLM